MPRSVADGTLTDSLIIKRTHNGNQSPYWWYQTTNQDYMQIFVPNGSTLENESGGIAKTVPAPINYARDGYSTDPLVLAIASTTQQSFSYPKVTTHEESGKQVFAVWSRTYAGSSTTFSLNYSHDLYSTPAPGEQYQFVFERPSGATGDYKIEVDAPLGYVFAENQPRELHVQFHEHAGAADVHADVAEDIVYFSLESVTAPLAPS